VRRFLSKAACSRRISRRGALVFNNLFLTTACATVFVGTLYPLALEALTGAKISVGPPFFDLTFGPLFIPLMAVMPFGSADGLETRRFVGRRAAAACSGDARGAGDSGGIRARARRPVLAPFGVGVASL